MGYYSDVCIVLKKESYERLKAVIDNVDPELRKEGPCLFDWTAEECQIDKGTGDVLLSWKSVKWYEAYWDVQVIINFLLEEDESNYKFLRIGEDYNDIESLGYGYFTTFRISIHREIKVEK